LWVEPGGVQRVLVHGGRGQPRLADVAAPRVHSSHSRLDRSWARDGRATTQRQPFGIFNSTLFFLPRNKDC